VNDFGKRGNLPIERYALGQRGIFVPTGTRQYVVKLFERFR
jgi:hypothetical protein